MEILIQTTIGTRPRGRLAMLVLGMLALSMLAAFTPRAAAETPDKNQAQRPFSLAEIQQIQHVRDLRKSGGPPALAKAAQTYLEKFPDGRYADEVLLVLGVARGRLEAPAESIAAYGRLIEEYPRSPFREQAMAGSIPLLMQAGEAPRAGAMAEALLRRYPRSIYRDTTLLWQARAKFQAEDYALALAPLEKIQPGALSPVEQTEYYHMAGWAYRHTDQPQKSRRYFAEYAKREDRTERKAPVLMQMGAALESEGKFAEAFSHYTQVVERHPHPDFLPEAMFRRADTFQKGLLEPAPTEARDALRLEAIGHYDAYLQSADSRHEETALRLRAQLLKSAGRNQEALRDYQRLAALSKAPRVDRALLVKIVSLLGEVGRGTEGAALLTRAIENSAVPQQERAVLTVERAALYYRAEDCKRVVAGLQPLPVFREAGHRHRAMFLRGFCYYRMQRWERASWDLEGVVNEPDYVELVWAALIDAYENSGQHSRLAHLGERLLDSGRVEASEDLLGRMAAAYEKLGQPTRMLSVIHRLQALNPDVALSAKMRLRLGRAEEAIGNLDKSKAHYLAALETRGAGGLSGTSLEALEHLQSLFLHGNDYEELAKLNAGAAQGTKAARQKRRIAALQAIVYLRWGQAQARAGNAEQARAKFERAWKEIPPGFSSQRLEILTAVADNYATANQHRKARKLFARELKRVKGRADKARISEAMGAFYLGWAAATEKKGPRAKVVARYEKALELLPPARWQERYRAVVRLDALHRKSSNFKARALLFERFALTLSTTVPAADLRTRLRVYRARIYRDWARLQLGKGNRKIARKLVARGEALLEEGEWRPRYELLAVRGEILIKRRRYSELLIRYEKFLPAIEDPALRAQVNHFLGQIYLTWAQLAQKARNVKSTRVRAWRALDYLPEEDWKRRLAAANLLNGALDKEKRPQEAAQLFEELIPTIPEKEVRQRYTVFLGKKYLKQLKQPEAAEAWLNKGDLGENDPVSLEAGYLKADLKLERKNRAAAIDLLEELTKRDLSQSNWRVPIHSRLAVLYHEDKALAKALENYRIVAAVKSKKLLKLYPRSIDIAREQVRAICGYLRFQGGSGPRVAVPKVNP